MLAAFYIEPGDSNAVSQVRADLDDHSQWFQRTLQDNAALPLSADIKQAIAQSQPALTDYIAQAKRIVELALADPASARAQMPAFDQAFEETYARIRDHGPGLPESELEKVFEPFYRLETSRNRNTGGTGLGLAIARNLLRRQQGQVHLHNHPAGGLEAVVVLPRKPGSSAA